MWQEKLSIPFDCVGGPDGGMNNLIFVEIAVRQSGSDDDEEPIAVFCSPLGTFQSGASLKYFVFFFVYSSKNGRISTLAVVRHAAGATHVFYLVHSHHRARRCLNGFTAFIFFMDYVI